VAHILYLINRWAKIPQACRANIGLSCGKSSKSLLGKVKKMDFIIFNSIICRISALATIMA